MPHWYQEGTIQFVTFRLADSLPKTFEHRDVRRYGDKKCTPDDNWMDKGVGSCLLKNREVRKILIDVIQHRNGVMYDLLAYVIMPNHVHLLILPLEDYRLNTIMGYIKRSSARMINKFLSKSGALWQQESFDRILRGKQDLLDYIEYIRQNPKGLNADSFDVFINPDLEKMF